MRMELWGGPHDGASPAMGGTPAEWLEPVPLTAAEAHEAATDPARSRPLRVAEYRHEPQRGRYVYVGQRWI